MTRVWLTGWEWSCCGDPFSVGDDVDFGVETRDAGPRLTDTLGSALVATVDAVESHHEEKFADRVRGRVVAVHAVTREVVERRSVRRPGHGAPPDAVMPADGEEWPLRRRELPGGAFVGSRPSRYVIEAVPVADSALLEEVRGVRLAEAESDDQMPTDSEFHSDPPPERRRRSVAGWLVDVDEQER